MRNPLSGLTLSGVNSFSPILSKNKIFLGLGLFAIYLSLKDELQTRMNPRRKKVFKFSSEIEKFTSDRRELGREKGRERAKKRARRQEELKFSQMIENELSPYTSPYDLPKFKLTKDDIDGLTNEDIDEILSGTTDEDLVRLVLSGVSKTEPETFRDVSTLEPDKTIGNKFDKLFKSKLLTEKDIYKKYMGYEGEEIEKLKDKRRKLKTRDKRYYNLTNKINLLRRLKKLKDESKKGI